jgi:hypothetical protein
MSRRRWRGTERDRVGGGREEILLKQSDRKGGGGGLKQRLVVYSTACYIHDSTCCRLVASTCSPHMHASPPSTPG